MAGAAAAFHLCCARAPELEASAANPSTAVSVAPAPTPTPTPTPAPKPAVAARSAPAAARPPGPDTWAELARCLRQPGFTRTRVTVDQVRHWVEVDHLRAWNNARGWWLPLSGEGTPRFASGSYAIVPAGDAPCSVAIVN